MDPRNKMLPPFGCIYGIATCARRTLPKKLTLNRRSHSLSSCCHPGSPVPLPMLATKMSGPPHTRLTAPIASRIADSSVRSPGMARTLSPKLARKSWLVASRATPSRPEMQTWHPSRRSADAIALPIPLEEPATNATRSVSLRSILFRPSGDGQRRSVVSPSSLRRLPPRAQPVV